MGLLILIIFLIGIIIFLYKKFTKKVITVILLVFFVIGIIIFLINKLDLIHKLVYEIQKNRPTISQEERNQAIAIVQYENRLGIDAQYFETYYIFNGENNTYFYYKMNSQITIAGFMGENIEKKGNINSSRQLEKIIDKLEKKAKSETEEVTIYYADNEITKDELFDKLFN